MPSKRLPRNHHNRKEQQFSLAVLFDFYESDPNEQYTIVAEGYRVRTVVGSGQDHASSGNSYRSNLYSNDGGSYSNNRAS